MHEQYTNSCEALQPVQPQHGNVQQQDWVERFAVDGLELSRLNRQIKTLRFGIASANRVLFVLFQRLGTQNARFGFSVPNRCLCCFG